MPGTNTAVRLAATQRTEFGKGAARRTRRDGNVPAVLYGHGTDPVHLSLPSLDFARVLRDNGTNAVVTIAVGSDEHLALVKTVVVHPIRNYIEHCDLLVIRRGEKVTVEINVVLVGEAAPGTLVTQESNTLEVEADVMSIPDELEVSVEGATVGTQILAGEVTLPDGATLGSDPESLVVNVVAAPTAEDLEAELDTEGAGVVQEPSDAEVAEAQTEAIADGGDTSSDD
ncbi:50S ribosomal protein L25/general stress protein Ctc [Rhodococcus antarcticus]|uniref:Large ribosomal subunit protein bL25 n=1 Tax=Rhodococcus antarcticus TaxID=2987751 RepID=A0ABY6NXY1_9NOCA|nr:50S ribosomal protein L25/general stress protein Ctc [Rhodococcus antarcticus]UZJ24079.1 50S ribosomal protein L25/general stress protein Ctc [Rhodococcus antarcticus]